MQLNVLTDPWQWAFNWQTCREPHNNKLLLGGESGTVGQFFFCHSTSLIQLRSLGTGCDHLVSLTSVLLSWSHSRRTTKVRFHGGRHNWGRSHEARVSRWPRATWETQVFENIKQCSNPADAVLPCSHSYEPVANMPWGKKQEVVCTGSRYHNVTENKRLTYLVLLTHEETIYSHFRTKALGESESSESLKAGREVTSDSKGSYLFWENVFAQRLSGKISL